MAVTLSTDQIAQTVFTRNYADLNPEEAQAVDDSILQATEVLDQWGQYINVDAGDAPAVWTRWGQLEAATIVAEIYSQQTLDGLISQRDKRFRDALRTFSQLAPNASTVADTDVTMQAIRLYVLQRIVSAWQSNRDFNPQSVPNVTSIDSSVYEVLNDLWNKSGWNFRRRQIVITVTPFVTSAATWDEALSTLTATGAFANYTSGDADSLYVRTGTGAARGYYGVKSRTDDDAIVLDGSISISGEDLATGDIQATLISTHVNGMNTGESLDEIATHMLTFETSSTVQYASGITGRRTKSVWASAAEMSSLASGSDTEPGMPTRFRMQSKAGVRSFFFWPIPLDTYTLYSEAFTKSAPLPTDATATDAFDAFPIEAKRLIPRLCWARVALDHSIPNSQIKYQTVMEEAEAFMRQADSNGVPGERQHVTDLSQDFAAFTDSGYGYGFRGVSYGGF